MTRLMPHKERRRLIEAPLPTTRRIPSNASWAGVSIQELDVFFEGLFKKRGPRDLEQDSPEMDEFAEEEEEK